MYLFFDTETNGLPKNYKASPTDVDNWPRIIQLAFVLTDEKFNVITEYCHLISPDGWEIPNQKFWIDNGYTTEENKKNGIPIKNALTEFIYHLEQSEFVLAHNMSFDHSVVSAELIRLGLKAKKRPQKICTMKSTTNFCALPRMKWPKLEELHQKLFGCKFDDAHDALADVKAMIRCFQYLKENELIYKWTL